MESLRDLPNIGDKLADELLAIGITSFDELADLGAVEVFIRLVDKKGDGCYNKLYALEGAIQQIRWHNLTKEEKDTLKLRYKEYLQA
ncbi:MAG: TfoX/Sxy family protein [Candidatus Heimdallarchaeota archaeon]|nr:TfoX/Sxy family protein [Candidatus Heimdallarchaeota archaeon]